MNMAEFLQAAKPKPKPDKTGITLRDQIAIAAMQVMIGDEGYQYDQWPNNIAHDAYKVADAMLKEREK